MTIKNDENISFLLEEKEDSETDNNYNMNLDLDDMLFLNENENENKNKNEFNNIELIYYFEKNVFSGEDETYYNEKYTIKELMKICSYYGIDKNIKASKCRKQDIVSTIVFYEGQSENINIVRQRHNMWAYMKELAADPKMRMYLIF